MPHHSRAQALAPQSQASEHEAENKDEQHASRAFVSVARPEDESGDDEPDVGFAAEDRNLSLQVSAEDELFDEAGNRAQRDKHQERNPRMRRKQVRQLLGFTDLRRLGQAQTETEPSDDDIGAHKKPECDCYVEQKVFDGIPPTANQVPDS